MRTKTVRNVIVALILISIAVFFLAGTFARYSTNGNANFTTEVAKWNVSIKDGDTVLTPTSQDLAFTVISDQYVVPNKMAPGTQATATITVNLTGTEVAVDLVPTVDLSNLPSELKNNTKFKVTANLNGTAVTATSTTTSTTLAPSITVPLVNDSAFTEDNGVKTLTLTLEWENSDTNNVADTAVGTLTDRTISIPVTFVARQHID